MGTYDVNLFDERSRPANKKLYIIIGLVVFLYYDFQVSFVLNCICFTEKINRIVWPKSQCKEKHFTLFTGSKVTEKTVRI